ncbi:copper amine oxidase N-terminal domain-containing protein [Zhenhengia yiwuensis]|uniref:copper amine oxidase N-terminal domain-containing protein n=1 Tax=Zhenhengia yiwuensis TaxID=2763666 RepID=UPI002A751374|nr:copper amine oxidase N-terminal domain-containing protein [Zhenhengia yiwuensis]MDY3367240.1 copper amine oxidase N-terminal domain-containing protein [Zhenhengia yiwuensis]
MKLRQKLAMVLATAMVITAVPVTTMAASTNGFNKTVSIVADKEVTSDSNLFLNVEYSDKDAEEVAKKGDTFFINAKDFEFTKAAYNHIKDGVDVAGHTASKGATVEWLSKSQLKVTVTAKDGDVAVAIVGTPKKGNPAITLDGEDSLATSGKYSLSGTEVVTDKLLAATAGDAKNISVDGYGEIADITIEERVAHAADKKEITITLPNSSDLIFNSKYAKEQDLKVEGKVEGKRGLAGEIVSAKVKYYEDSKGNVDNKKLVVVVDTNDDVTARGSIVLKGIEVQAEDKKGDVETGEVKVTVKADKMEDTKLVVANVAEYGVSFKVSEAKELVAGQGSKEIELVVKENAVDSISEKKDIFFTIEEGYFDVDDVEAFNKDNASKGISINKDKDEITLDVSEAGFKANKINEFKFKVNVGAKASQEGPVVVVASSKNFEEDMKVEVAKVGAAVQVKSEALTVKAGLKDQVGGKIVITETKEERLAKNKEIRIACAEDKYGFDIKDAKVKVTGGDIEVKSEVKDGEIIIKVTRSSDEASEITVTDVEVTTDRTVPEGTFDFQVGGTAISKLNAEKDLTSTKEDERFEDVIEIKEFIKVGTKNTEDLPNAAAAKEIVLTVGSTAYTVNGEAKTADAAPEIDKNGRTMVPVRFVAEEFGKVDFGTINGVGTVTIFKDGAVLQFQNGSNIMNKNGINVPMDTQVVVKNGRTYVPFKYVADGLGINYNYDAATKSITFTNQAK